MFLNCIGILSHQVVTNLLPAIHAEVFKKMILDLNQQLENDPKTIPVVNFLDPKYGFVPVATEDTKTRSPQQTRKHSHPMNKPEDSEMQVSSSKPC